MTETITTNENQPKEEKIKRLIQRKIDELDKQWWKNEEEGGSDMKSFTIHKQGEILKELLKEIETL